MKHEEFFKIPDDRGLNKDLVEFDAALVFLRTIKQASENGDYKERMIKCVYFANEFYNEIDMALENQLEGGWHPIDLAPTDGTEVLIYVPSKSGRNGHKSYQIVARNEADDDDPFWEANGEVHNPTQFKYLVDPPKEKPVLEDVF